MFVFTLQIYTIIFSTKFEPFELEREQKDGGDHVLLIAMFHFHKSKQCEHNTTGMQC